MREEKIRELTHLLRRQIELKAEDAEIEEDRARRKAMAEKEREKSTLSDLIDAGVIVSTMAAAAEESGGVPSILAVYADPAAAMALNSYEQRQAKREERAQQIERGF